MNTRLMFLSTAILLTGFAAPSGAQNAPSGWNESETGITKGKSRVSIGEVQHLEGQSASEFLATLENTAPDGTVFVSSGGIKDGKYVAQVKREITVDGTSARSVLMVCKGGANQHRLLEVFSENSKVIDLITGARYAIGVCAN